MLGGEPNYFSGQLEGANLTGVYLGANNFTVSETTIFSNGTIGANLINSTFSSLNGLLAGDVDFRGVNLAGVNRRFFPFWVIRS